LIPRAEMFVRCLSVDMSPNQVLPLRIDTLKAACILRKQRRDACPLLVRKPK
jgi:hypothetical protein